MSATEGSISELVVVQGPAKTHCTYHNVVIDSIGVERSRQGSDTNRTRKLQNVTEGGRQGEVDIDLEAGDWASNNGLGNPAHGPGGGQIV